MMEQPAIDLRIVRAVKNLTPGTFEEVYKKEGEEPYFRASGEEGVFFVSNDIPRDGAYTEELMQQTLGFAIVDGMGRVHKKFGPKASMSKVEDARANARINFDPIIEVDIDDEQENENNGEE